MKEKISLLKGILILLFAGTILVSCEKDEDEPIDLLIGTWTAESADVDLQVDGKTLTQYFTDLGYPPAQAQSLTTTINALLQQQFTGSLTLNADKTYTADLGTEADSGTWNLSSDSKQLTIDSSTEAPFILDIERLTENELVVTWNEVWQEDLNEDEIPENLDMDITLTLNK